MDIRKLFVLVTVAFGSVTAAAAQTWTLTTAPSLDWLSVASSADGQRLLAGGYSALYTSTNGGTTWTTNNVPAHDWACVASSADGNTLTAGVGFPDTGLIYVSTNAGTLWTTSNVPSLTWSWLAMSADGIKLFAVANGGNYAQPIYMSTNSGVTWTTNSYPAVSLFGLTSSADGTKLATTRQVGNVITSTNSGGSWTTNHISAPFLDFPSLAGSADGNTLVVGAGGNGGHLYVSSNSGISWNTNATVKVWYSVAASADGHRLIAGSFPAIYTSSDSGNTWITNTAPSLTWRAVASSADGTKLVAATFPGGIYTLKLSPSSPVNIGLTPSNNLTLSWVLPSTNFVLQQCSNLINWSTVTNPPVLNQSNLQNQVTLPPPSGNTFYRLITQ